MCQTNTQACYHRHRNSKPATRRVLAFWPTTRNKPKVLRYKPVRPVAGQARYIIRRDDSHPESGWAISAAATPMQTGPSFLTVSAKECTQGTPDPSSHDDDGANETSQQSRWPFLLDSPSRSEFYTAAE